MNRLFKALVGALVPAVAAGASLGGCASKGDVQAVQGEVALLKAETARRDSARAAQLMDVIRMQQTIDGLAAGHPTDRGAAQGRARPRSVQHPAAAGAAPGAHRPEPAAAERAADPARGARRQIETGPAPGDTATPIQPGTSGSASADQMYEASLAQLRRGSLSTARLGLREMLRTYPTSERAADALLFHRAELRVGESGFGAGLLQPGGGEIRCVASRARRRCTTSGSSPSDGKRRPRRAMPTSAWPRSTPSPTKPRSPVTD